MAGTPTRDGAPHHGARGGPGARWLAVVWPGRTLDRADELRQHERACRHCLQSQTVALRFDPSYAEAHDYYAMFLVANRRFQAAVEEILRARQLDPVSGLIAADAAWIFYLKRDYDQFLEQARAAVELAPN